MNDESDSLAGPFRELAREARQRQGPGAHPSPETLTAYHAGELSPAAEENVQEHLAVCRHCAQLLLDLPAFLEAPVPRPEDLAVADASWEELRRRLPKPSKKTGRRREFAAAWRDGPPRAFLLFVAALLLALIVVPLWIVARRLSSSPLPPAYAELRPFEGQRGMQEPAPMPVTVHADAASTTLILHLAKEQPDLRFRVDLRASGTAGAAGAPGGPSIPLPSVLALDSRTLLLLLARRQLAPGLYQLRVLDPEHPSAEPLGDYPLRVIEP